jgi:type II secretory pathway component PulF
VAVFKYTATTVGEEHTETGTIVAEDESQARKKLKSMKFEQIHLKKLNGLSSLLNRFTATIR